MKRHNLATFILGILILISGIQCNEDHGKSGSGSGNGIGSSIESSYEGPNKMVHGHNSTRDSSELDHRDNCCISLRANWLFHQMGKLDAKYADARNAYHEAAEKNNFDQILLNEMLKAQGESQRDIHSAIVNHARIPRGFSLGGRCMIRLDDSILFFHRLRLRNSTTFRVTSLHSDLANMTLSAHLLLHDLHMGGSYERALAEIHKPSNLFYRPTYGEVDILLKNVRYQIEGRYRLLKDQLVIELVLSDIAVSQILLMYQPNGTADDTVQKIEIGKADRLLQGIKLSLDIWLKSYFNDYLRYFGLSGVTASNEFQEYDRLKTSTLNRYADQSIETFKEQMRKHKATCMVVPEFTVFTINGMQIRLKNGKLRGLDTLHRRSMATGKLMENNGRRLDAIVGFGKLRLVYQYEAVISSDSPPVTGLFVLSSDHLTAKMALAVVPHQPETSDLSIAVYQQLKEETLTVEGPLIRKIANFKHILELHIMTLMYNTLMYHLSLLGQLNKCDPKLPGPCVDGDISLEEEPLEKPLNRTTPCQCPSTEKTKSKVSDDDELSPGSNETRSDGEIRVSREETFEIYAPDRNGKMVTKKVRYWEGAAIHGDKSKIRSTNNIRIIS